MKHFASFAIAALLACAMAPALAQDKVTATPVHFSKGASSASLPGAVKGYESAHYTLSATAGQTMRVSISGSSNANFNVFAPGDVPGAATAIGSGAVGQDWSGVLPSNGSYTVQVYQMRATARRGQTARYTISFGIH
ncbi:MAG: g-type lysozyme inhibitor [Stenotrophomonas sp.]|uniref:g-type lysozyme inhibitor n=1 Tax=Stenotrophomonas sp. TaxID=69392 RepID=UPI003D6D66EA